MYDYNHQPSRWDIEAYDRAQATPGSRVLNEKEQLHKWGGPRTRRLLWAVYTIAFTCLLRSDEVLNIQAHHVKYNAQTLKLTITLPFRKTAQFGGECHLHLFPPADLFTHFSLDVKPFEIWALPEHEAHICPVRALNEWITTSKINRGYIFRKITSDDRIHMKNEPMVRNSFFPDIFLLHVAVVRTFPQSFPTQSARYGDTPILIWDTFVSPRRCTVFSVSPSVAFEVDLRMGRMEHGIFLHDDCEIFNLLERRASQDPGCFLEAHPQGAHCSLCLVRPLVPLRLEDTFYSFV